jgi:predicted nucleotidyltransferase
MLDKATAIEKAKQYAVIVQKALNPFAIVMYGSYVNGVPHENSDIDVAVIFNGFLGDWLRTSADLWKFTEDVSLDIEPILLDTASDNSGFAQEVMRTGNLLFSAQR